MPPTPLSFDEPQAFPTTPADQAHLRALVRQLPRLQRDIVVRRFWGLDSIADIATALGLDWDDVAGLLKTALGKLAAECGGPAALGIAQGRVR